MKLKTKNKQKKKFNETKEPVSQVDCLRTVDIMGERFQFSYTTTRSRFRTSVGGCITILVLLLSLAGFVYISSQYFDTTSPVVNSSRELSNSALSFNVYAKGLFPGMSIVSNGIVKSNKTKNFITVKGQIVRKIFNPVTNITEVRPLKSYSYIPCGSLDYNDPVRVLNRKITDVIDPNISLCPDYKEVDNNITISKNPETLSSAYLTIKVYPCSLPDKNECYPVQKIFGSEFSTGEIASLLSPSNYTKPVAFRWVRTSYLLDITRSKSVRYTLLQNKIIDDRHFFKKPEIKGDYPVFMKLISDTWARDPSQLYCSSVMIDTGDCEEFLNFVYEIDSDVMITTRRYKQIPVLVGEFGGVLKFLTTALIIISFFYSKLAKKYLFQKVFPYQDSTVVEMIKKFALIEKREKIVKKGHISQAGATGGGFGEKKNNLRRFAERESRFSSKLIKGGKLGLKSTKEGLIDAKTDIIGLVRKMSFVDLISKASIKSYHKTLLPLLVLRLKMYKPVKNRVNQSSAFSGSERNSERLSHSKLQKLSEQEETSSKVFLKDLKKRNSPSFWDLRESYRTLKQSRAKTVLEEISSQKILSYLAMVFEELGERDSSEPDKKKFA